jgi:receptor-type tyrosine-protein phosphatase gamma
MVTAFTPSEYQYSSARMEFNVIKNRNSNLIPVESSRIPLAPKPGVEGSDYINASWYIFIISKNNKK